MTSDLNTMLRSVAAWAIDYLRWTQLIPMLVAWAFLLLALAMLALVNFQEEGFTVVEMLVLTWERYAWLPRLDGAVTSEADGSMRLDGDGFRGIVVSTWAGVSFLLFLLAQLRRAVFGPTAPVPFRRKLIWPLAGAGVVWAALLSVYLFGSETFHGSPIGWIALFTGACGAAFLVSVYSLGVGELLARLRNQMQEGPKLVAPVDQSTVEAGAP